MKNDMQIAIIKLNFQSFSEKLVSTVQCPKLISRNI